MKVILLLLFFFTFAYTVFFQLSAHILFNQGFNYCGEECNKFYEIFMNVVKAAKTE